MDNDCSVFCGLLRVTDFLWLAFKSNISEMITILKFQQSNFFLSNFYPRYKIKEVLHFGRWTLVNLLLIPSKSVCIAYPYERYCNSLLQRGIALFKVSLKIFVDKKRKVPIGVAPLVDHLFPVSCANGNSTTPWVLFLFIPRREKITDCLSSLLLPADNYSVASNQS